MSTAAAARSRQSSLLDLSHREFNPYWVDENQPLIIPNNPLHYEAHKLQIALERLDLQLQNNPAQFNSGNYLALVNKLSELWKAINKQDEDANDGDSNGLDEGNVSTGLPEPGTAPGAGEEKRPGVDPGVSSEDISARSGPLPL